MKRKIVSALLVMSMTASLVACGNSGSGSSDPADESVSVSSSASSESDASASASSESEAEAEESEMPEGYDETSTELYNEALGDFNDALATAKKAETVDERYALMAVAEGKLMESAMMYPLISKGGMYAMYRMAPRTRDYTLWGSDQDRYHQYIVTTDFIKAEDYNEMRAKWDELKGTGTYESWVKEYLAGKGYTLKDSFSMPYASDPVTWDGLATSLAADTNAIINTYDGLMEYDVEGTLQPALAESYEVSDDGLTYTFHLRKDVKWTDSQGREVDTVKADDFVAGMQHMCDAQGGLEYLVQGVIKNASQYISGEITDFDEVGVKAVDDYTVEYTLEKPCSYFETMLGYTIFMPMSRSYYQSQGGKFGAEYDSSAADYQYGKDSNSIAYCGPYLVTNATAKNTIVFKLSDSYWNKDNVNIKTLTWLYNDQSDVTKMYTDAKAGTVDYVNLNTSTMETAKSEGLYDQYAVVSDTDATSFMAFYNINRTATANANDGTTAKTTKSDEEIQRTNKAMQNVHFRRAISFAADRGAYNAQQVGEDLKYTSLRNTFTPGYFVSLSKDTTIQINGTDTTFPAGTYYGEIVQKQIDADGVKIKVWDAENKTSDGFDGWYNPENAVEELNTAIEELAEEGITIDESNPIQIEYPYPSAVEVYTNKANSYKKSVEAAFGGKVVINLVDAVDVDGWYYAGYYVNYGYEENYDVYDVSGWSPDFGDPCSYLDTMLPDYEGYMTKCFGIF
ncbi:peptide ABC transporter substrate-binding protein [Fusicatenibacter saccharivorans]|uniref:ABC transporter substrate-binding protein n=1 Tax=Fusicatenibacter saccharivorans TaxID=1150298 RepID=UPI00156DE2D7|nr:ABC transporter substrate-binding protein [Fusicatenibacter saccharivorans]NSD20549.1 peptide ABC transporter substrate-binding protein [Fusicatenibacter saccharivorans]